MNKKWTECERIDEEGSINNQDGAYKRVNLPRWFSNIELILELCDN